ncbi:MAG: hypothetical protein MJB12_18745 [Firmicutes bacterium]|nr:hypothetical protein [Bacillota bacterium]
MAAKNMVVSGDCKGKAISQVRGTDFIMAGLLKSIDINSDTVESYEVLNEAHQKSATSAIGSAAAGSLLLGPLGFLAGLTAKTKGSFYRHTKLI